MSRDMRKQTFCICENKDADQLRGNREADQRLCFRYSNCTIPLLYFLNTKFQASSHLVWLYSLVCVGPGGKPRRLVFSCRGSFDIKEQCPLKSQYILTSGHLKRSFFRCRLSNNILFLVSLVHITIFSTNESWSSNIRSENKQIPVLS